MGTSSQQNWTKSPTRPPSLEEQPAMGVYKKTLSSVLFATFYLLTNCDWFSLFLFFLEGIRSSKLQEVANSEGSVIGNKANQVRALSVCLRGTEKVASHVISLLLIAANRVHDPPTSSEGSDNVFNRRGKSSSTCLKICNTTSWNAALWSSILVHWTLCIKLHVLVFVSFAFNTVSVIQNDPSL